MPKTAKALEVGAEEPFAIVGTQSFSGTRAIVVTNRGVGYFSFRRPEPAEWLSRGLESVKTLKDESQEDGLLPPAKQARQGAIELIEKISAKDTAPEPYVYSGENRGVEMLFQCRTESVVGSVWVIFDKDGGASCYVSINSENSRAHFENSGRIGQFVIHALDRMSGETV